MCVNFMCKMHVEKEIKARVLSYRRQGMRTHMEDYHHITTASDFDKHGTKYLFMGVFDGHGGDQAAIFAKENLLNNITRLPGFWSDDDDVVITAIKYGFFYTHYEMWSAREFWPLTKTGHRSVAGTTASIVIIKNGKIYTAHVGDSTILMGVEEPGFYRWTAKALTTEHKPEVQAELARITLTGGKVALKAGVPRVVWTRQRNGAPLGAMEEVPLLSIARSLGDLWSYNADTDEFSVSPEPDCSVIPIDLKSFRCIILGTDGIFDIISHQTAVNIACQLDEYNRINCYEEAVDQYFMSPAQYIVDKALQKYASVKVNSDNVTAVTLTIDPSDNCLELQDNQNQECLLVPAANILYKK